MGDLARHHMRLERRHLRHDQGAIVVLFMAPSSQRPEPPQNPGRFTS